MCMASFKSAPLYLYLISHKKQHHSCHIMEPISALNVLGSISSCNKHSESLTGSTALQLLSHFSVMCISQQSLNVSTHFNTSTFSCYARVSPGVWPQTFSQSYNISSENHNFLLLVICNHHTTSKRLLSTGVWLLLLSIKTLASFWCFHNRWVIVIIIPVMIRHFTFWD